MGREEEMTEPAGVPDKEAENDHASTSSIDNDMIVGAGKARGRFFAIERQVFYAACTLGLGPSLAYLTLASGTGRDHSTTSWGVHSIEQYTGLSRGRAKTALEDLVKYGLLKATERQKRVGAKLIQKRKLLVPPDKAMSDLIWLPNQIIVGASHEQPPISILREVGDPLEVRLFGDLYGTHQLTEYGGVDPSIVHEMWVRKKVGERGAWAVWGFSRDRQVCRAGNIEIEAHGLWDEDAEDFHRPDHSPFWIRLKSLEDAGLIEWIPTVFNSREPDAQPLFPVDGSLPEEQALAKEIKRAALSLLPDWDFSKHELIVPLQKHLQNAEVKGIIRMRYRPKTVLTSQWYRELCNRLRRHLTSYQSVTKIQSMQDQVFIK